MTCTLSSSNRKLEKFLALTGLSMTANLVSPLTRYFPCPDNGMPPRTVGLIATVLSLLGGSLETMNEDLRKTKAADASHQLAAHADNRPFCSLVHVLPLRSIKSYVQHNTRKHHQKRHIALTKLVCLFFTNESDSPTCERNNGAHAGHPVSASQKCAIVPLIYKTAVVPLSKIYSMSLLTAVRTNMGV